ncbi:hypothetical protein KDW_56650 [Dictyobacter vulcani]|uniref:Ornithine cyclodeaminase n=1 Tax=Dictyobacter vulcani TaxID=2607529 RepID=A0A5J4KV72_9CHLR|nr:hypothetical protein KDW_56650 [Dictyobacter vulcani]
MRFLITLYSAIDGQLLALIEASWLGSMRTGAASALATLHLSRPESSVVGLIGAGNQAMTQLMGMCAVRQVTDVLVYCRNQHEREFFCQQMQRRLSITMHAVNSIQQAVESADILITATTAGEPIIDGNWLQPGCHINAIGSNWAQRRELDSRTLQRCAIISTDSLEQAHIEAGDLLIPIQEGNLRWDDVYELASIINGEGPQRELPEDITLFKSLGVALEDIATAAHVYTLACQQGLGEEIDLLS